jgi:hopanoid biosynthesis associated RND transporter like protein HpnN
MRQRTLEALAGLICRRPWWFVLGGVLLAVAAALYTARSLEFKTSRNDLIGRDSDYWRNYSAYAREFRAEEDYIILVESDHPARNRAGVDALVEALLSPANNPHAGDAATAQPFAADDIFYRVDFNAMKPWFLYYLSVDDLTQIRDSVKDFKQLLAILEHDPRLSTFLDSMSRMLDQMATAPEAQRRQIEAFLPTVTGIVRQMGEFQGQEEPNELLSPWAGAFFSSDMVGEAEQQMQWQGYQTFQHGKMFIVLVHPRAGTDAGIRHEGTIPKLRRIIADVHQQFPDLRISLTGEPVLDYDEMTESQRDATHATLLTLVLVAVLFGAGFREVLRPVLAVGGMVIVLAVSMGYATLSVGHLNMITVTFAVMILGLGIDLGIQFIARYEEELSKGATRTQAVATAIERAGLSIITAGVTNAAAFFAMGLSGFRGVTELGVIAGGGMLIATAATVLVLPALLLVVRREHESTNIPARAAATRVEHWLLRQPSVTLGICVALTLAALLVGWRVRFDYNVLNLQSRRAESVKTEMRLLNADAESTIFAAVVCDNLEQARALTHSLTGLPTVAVVHSIAELIPEQQEQKAKIIRTIQEGLGDVKFTLPPFDPADSELVMRSLASLRLRAGQLAREAGERGDRAGLEALTPLTNAVARAREELQAQEPTVLQKHLAAYEARFYGDLEAQLKLMADQIVTRPMGLDDVPQNVRRMLVGRTGKLLLRIFPRENIWDREPLEKFVREVQRVAPHVTGTPLGLYEFVDILLRGYIKAAIWAFLVILVLVFADFRSGCATLFTLLPLVVGMIWMVGAMTVLGIPFNPANIMVLPLLVGIGVAYGIYVVQRYREDGEASFYGKSTGRAVVLSALTAIVAFGSLIIGAHRGIRSLGLLMIIGISDCLVAALALLPALLETARRRGWKV